MSDKLGSVRYAGQQLQYLGRLVEENSQISPETREEIDKEVRQLITEQYERAQMLLQGHQAALEILAKQLLDHETVEASAVRDALLEGSPSFRQPCATIT